MKKFYLLYPICLLAILVFLGSCGGGGDPQVTAETPTNPTDPTTPTTENTAFFIGEIKRIDRTGTARVVVNGVELSVPEGTPVEFEPDDIGSFDALKVGMVIRVEGVLFEDRTTGRADRIQFQDKLEGPIIGITETTPGLIKALNVMGHKVVVEDGVTSFDDRDPSFHFGTLATGQIVEIDGFSVQLLSVPTIIATFARKKADDLESFLAEGDDLEVMGSLQISPDTNSPTIGDLIVDISAATGSFRIPGFVEVKGDFYDPVTNTLKAINVEDVPFPEGWEPASGDFSWGEIEGMSHLTNIGFGVSADHPAFVVVENSRFIGLSPVSVLLKPLIRIEGEGPILQGHVRAERVVIKDDVHLKGLADTVDAATGKVTLQGFPGITVVLDAARTDPQIEGGELDFSRIRPGHRLTIQGHLSALPGNRSVLAAVIFHSEFFDAELILQGQVENFDEETGIVTILGVPVDTSDIIEDDFFVGAAYDSDLYNPFRFVGSGREAFFAPLQIGDLVAVRGQLITGPDGISPLLSETGDVLRVWQKIRVFK